MKLNSVPFRFGNRIARENVDVFLVFVCFFFWYATSKMNPYFPEKTSDPHSGGGPTTFKTKRTLKQTKTRGWPQQRPLEEPSGVAKRPFQADDPVLLSKYRRESKMRKQTKRPHNTNMMFDARFGP